VGLLGESTTSLSEQSERSTDDGANDGTLGSPVDHRHHQTSANTEIRKSSVTSVGAGATKEFFSTITSDINGLATQTSTMFSDLFGESRRPNCQIALPYTPSPYRYPDRRIPGGGNHKRFRFDAYV